MHIVVTGADGFIGRNLRTHLREAGHAHIDCVTSSTSEQQLSLFLARADFVLHLAGVNRPVDVSEFARGNTEATAALCTLLQRGVRSRPVPVAFASSTQALLDNPYGRSKRAAEEVLLRYGEATGAPVYLFRLTNVFGKWSRPDYNSVVATFCHRLCRGLPITVNDADAPLQLVYIDDVVAAFGSLLAEPQPAGGHLQVAPEYSTTVGELAEILREVAQSRASLTTSRVGTGFLRALYATYISHLPPELFAYTVPRHADRRGEFIEMLKTPDCGQFSYFTAHPGVTRGEHYHHSKTEKFLILRGRARFRFRHIITDDTHELEVAGGEGHIVETVPGWAHNITNVGEEELLVMIWANEIFDRARPDTIAMQVG